MRKSSFDCRWEIWSKESDCKWLLIGFHNNSRSNNTFSKRPWSPLSGNIVAFFDNFVDVSQHFYFHIIRYLSQIYNWFHCSKTPAPTGPTQYPRLLFQTKPDVCFTWRTFKEKFVFIQLSEEITPLQKGLRSARCCGSFPSFMCLVFHEEVVSCLLLFPVFHRIQLVDSRSEIGWVSSESDIQIFQKFVHSCHKALRSLVCERHKHEHNYVFARQSMEGFPSYTITLSDKYVAMMKSCSTTNPVFFACRMNLVV
jgi:hypothetical protein